MKKILYILSYFIRCSDILESTEQGCLETYLEKLNFSAESPCDSDKNLAHRAQSPSNDSERTFGTSSPTPVNSCPKFPFPEENGVDLPSCPSLKLDSLLSNGVKSMSSASDRDCNSNNQGSDDVSGSGKICPACERNNYSQDFQESNKFGKSVFYVSSPVCFCDKSDSSDISVCDKRDSVEKLKMQRKKDSLRLSLKIPSDESQNNQQCTSSSNSNETGNDFTDSEKCRLSMAEIIEDAKVEKAGHSRKAVDIKVTQVSTHSVGVKDVKIPQHVDKVLSREEIKSIFRHKGSDSMFNEYFDEEGIVAKTIDEIDEKDRVVALPPNKQHNLSGEATPYWNEDDPNKAPSLPDLTAVKTDSSHGKGDCDRSHRNRLGSLDQSYKRRRFSLSRQMSESSNKILPGRCRYAPFYLSIYLLIIIIDQWDNYNQ